MLHKPASAIYIWTPTGNKCRTSDLTVQWQASANDHESCNWFIEKIAHYKGCESEIKMQIRHVENVYSVKNRSTMSFLSPMWRWSLSKTDTVSGSKWLSSFFRWPYKQLKPANGKEVCQARWSGAATSDGYHFCPRKHLFFLIWQSLESLPVYVSCNSVLLELSSIRLRFSFFI